MGETRKLRIEIATVPSQGSDSTDALVEAFDSNARLRGGRWFHVALVRLDSERQTRLYINGILDTSMSTKGFGALSKESLYIGGDPVASDQCDVPMYIDE